MDGWGIRGRPREALWCLCIGLIISIINSNGYATTQLPVKRLFIRGRAMTTNLGGAVGELH